MVGVLGAYTVLSFLPVTGDVIDATDVAIDLFQVCATPNPINMANLEVDLIALSVPFDGLINNIDTMADIAKYTGRSNGKMVMNLQFFAEKGASNATPEFGKKLEYVFGNATGSRHNI